MSKTLEQLTKDVDYLLDVVEKQDKLIEQLLEETNTKVEVLLSCSELSFLNKIEAPKLTANKKRKEALKYAREILSTYVFFEHGEQRVIYDHNKYEVEYVVFEEYREVKVVLMPLKGGKTLMKDFKFNYNDTWNVDIGLAIALGRILHLDIDLLLNAENPDKVVKGHIVRWNNTGAKYVVTEVNHLGNYTYYSFKDLTCDTKCNEIPYENIESLCTIINDDYVSYDYA